MELTIEHRFPSPGVHLCGLAWDGQMLWHSDADTNLLYRVDPEDGEIALELPFPDVRTGLTYHDGALWQVLGRPKSILRINPETGEIKARIELGPNLDAVCGVRVDAESFWLGPESTDPIVRHSRSSNAILAQYGPDPSADGLCLVGTRLCHTSYRDRTLAAIAIDTGESVARFDLPEAPTDMCTDGDLFWLNSFSSREIWAVRTIGETAEPD